jgi:hypothetical protein
MVTDAGSDHLGDELPPDEEIAMAQRYSRDELVERLVRAGELKPAGSFSNTTPPKLKIVCRVDESRKDDAVGVAPRSEGG